MALLEVKHDITGAISSASFMLSEQIMKYIKTIVFNIVFNISTLI